MAPRPAQWQRPAELTELADRLRQEWPRPAWRWSALLADIRVFRTPKQNGPEQA